MVGNTGPLGIKAVRSSERERQKGGREQRRENNWSASESKARKVFEGGARHQVRAINIKFAQKKTKEDGKPRGKLLRT